MTATRIGRPLASMYVTQTFGERPEVYRKFGLDGHEGVDLRAAVGTPVYAAHDGWVQVSDGPTYGRQVWVYGDGVLTVYAHLSESDLKTGQTVTRGQEIGRSGNSGRSTGPHLHFGIKVRGVANSAYKDWLDPMLYMEEEAPMKTTLHAQRWLPWMNLWLADLGAAWSKCVNPPEGMAAPTANHVVRMWTDDLDAAYIGRGAEGGREFVRRMLPIWRARPAAYYELANEPDANSNAGLQNLNAYTLGAMQEADAQGVKLVILNLPEGSPHDNGTGDESVCRWKLQQIKPSVDYAARNGHLVGLHAYWRPGVCGPTDRWHALGNVRWNIEQWLSLGVPASLRVIVNECGIDGGIAGHQTQQGWRQLTTADAYRAQIVEAEQYARGVAQIVALTYFTAGFEPPWGGYDIDEAFARSWLAPLATLGGATMPEPNVPPVVQLPSVEEIREAAWNRLGIAYNPTAAFPRYAREHDMGLPMTPEFDHQGIRIQGYGWGIVFAPIGEWDKVTHLYW